MKTKLVALALGLITMSSFAQKNELKAAEKAIKKENFDAAVTALSSAEPLIANADNKYKAKYYYLKGQAFAGKKDYEKAGEAYNQLLDFETSIKKKTYTGKVGPMLNKMIDEVSSKGSRLYGNKDYKGASRNFYLTYVLSPKDTSYLYNAAVSANQAKDYEGALKYFDVLKKVGYTGITTMFMATNKETGKEENLGSKVQRDIMIKSGSYEKPYDKKSESKQGTIMSSVAAILIKQGKTEEAIAALEEARKGNPDDVNLILVEADLYVKLDRMDKFGELMELAVKQKPNDPTLYYNLGVVNMNQKKKEEAKKYYEKAIELKPDYGDAYMNMAVLILDEEKAIVEEMNKNLSDFDKYDELQAKQKGVYKKALPYLEKADSLGRTLNTVQTLLNMYETLEIEEKAKVFRKLYKEMRG